MDFTPSSSSHVETASDAAGLFRAALPINQCEERVFVLPLDATGNALAKPILVSVGDKDGTATIDVGDILREALKASAEEIIIAHNHPSGDLTPSRADIDTSERIRQGAELVGLRLLDHLILGKPSMNGDEDFVSIAELSVARLRNCHNNND